jgi:hypothetical protein
MTFSSQQFTLGTGVATLIVESNSNWQKVMIHNQEKSGNRYIFLGGSDVTQANGVHIDNSETEHIDLTPGAEIWATTNYNGLNCGVVRQIL